MTTSEPTDLESIVVNNLEFMLLRYRKIDALADQMLACQDRGNAIQEDLQTLQRERETIQKFELESRPINEAYRNSRENASDTVAKLTEQTATLVQSLISKIARLEQAAKDSYQRLFPQINQNLRGQQMKQAYGKTHS